MLTMDTLHARAAMPMDKLKGAAYMRTWRARTALGWGGGPSQAKLLKARADARKRKQQRKRG